MGPAGPTREERAKKGGRNIKTLARLDDAKTRDLAFSLAFPPLPVSIPTSPLFSPKTTTRTRRHMDSTPAAPLRCVSTAVDATATPISIRITIPTIIC